MNEKLVEELLKGGKRLEKRGFLDFREIKVEKEIVPKSEGSARVKIGNTDVVAGVKIELAEPFKDSKEDYVLIVNAEFAPIAHESFEPGPPSEEAIELARLIDRLIRSSKAIDSKNLKISENLVYGIFIDIHILNHDGNLLDASALAAVNALNNAKLPKYENEQLIRNEIIGNIKLNYFPLFVTIGKFENNYLVDLNQFEEEVVKNRLAIGLRDDNCICAVQLLKGSFSFDEIEKLVEIAEEKVKDLRKYIIKP